MRRPPPRPRAAGRLLAVSAVLCASAALAAPRALRAQEARTLEVAPGTALSSLAEAIRRSAPGGRILVRAGAYREPTITVDRALTIEGERGAVLDGSGSHTILVVAADDVTVRGLTLRNTGPSQTEERAGIRVENARGCRIERNRLERTLFAIHLSKASGCVVSRNVIRGAEGSQAVSGNGVHVWSSERVEVSHNDILGHRDGIYFEFVKEGVVVENRAEGSARYGMHFMFSDDCAYERNVFRDNSNGVAVMYSKRVTMAGNRFERNWGGAAYGLLLKDISDSRIVGNEFTSNSTGLYLEDANRNLVTGNAFRGNGWALKVMANAQENRFERNTFAGNSFDVATNSRSNFSRFEENYWDRYRGYDLDRDGFGDVPHAPVRLFALVVAQSPPTLILLRSLLVNLLDVAERIFPSLTPATLVDEHPLMREPAAREDSRG